MDTKHYLGQWIDNDPRNGDTIVECISVDMQHNAIFSNGMKIKIMDLDHSDRFEKIMPITEAPEVVNQLGEHATSLRSRAPQSSILGDLSKIGRSKHESNIDATIHLDEVVAIGSEFIESDANISILNKISDDPIETFISNAISISKKNSKITKVPVNITLNIDFDLLTIINSAAALGIDDVSIINIIIKYIDIDIKDIKNLIVNALLTPIDNKEEMFEKHLQEEINRNTENTEPIYTEL